MRRVVFHLFCSLVVTIGLSGVGEAQTLPGKGPSPGPAPRRAQPQPPKPVSEGEMARAARINNWTVGITGGLLEGTLIRYAAELGTALDDGDNLRVLPIVSYGAVGNITDLIYLKGVDFAITYSDALGHFKKSGEIPGIENRLNYVIAMFQGEVHILARKEIRSVQELAGKVVNFDVLGSAANYTGGVIFDRLGIKTERQYLNNAVALEKLRTGEIAAIVHVAAKPNDLFSKVEPSHGLHFLPVDFSSKFDDFYVPAELSATEYPALIPQGDTIQTISVPAVLAVFNWKVDTDRYRRCVRFVEYLFDRFDRLADPPFQPGWKQMNLAGSVPGWTRFPPAQEQIEKMVAKSGPGVDVALARMQAARAAPNSKVEQDRLFQEFLEWSKRRSRN